MTMCHARRRLIQLPFAAATVAVAGCGFEAPGTIQPDVAVMKSFADAFGAQAANLGLSAAEAANIKVIVGEIDATTTVIAALTPESAPGNVPREFVTVFNSLLSLAGAVPSPPMPADVHGALVAAGVLLPIVETFFKANPALNGKPASALAAARLAAMPGARAHVRLQPYKQTDAFAAETRASKLSEADARKLLADVTGGINARRYSK